MEITSKDKEGVTMKLEYAISNLKALLQIYEESYGRKLNEKSVFEKEFYTNRIDEFKTAIEILEKHENI